MVKIRDTTGAEAILPFCYGGSNGLLTQDTNDAALFHGHSARRVSRAPSAPRRPAPPTWALYGKMPGVTYADYVHARLIVLWGVNPAASGIHLVPYVREARKLGAKLVVDRSAHDVARAAGRPAPRAQAGHRPADRAGACIGICSSAERSTNAFLAEHTRGADDLARARATNGRSSAPPTRPASIRAALERFAELYRSSSPALMRCGWGLERNRNGGSAAAAVLALPAIGGKFGVRGGGFSMSNSTAFGIKSAAWMNDTPEPATRLVNMNHLGRALTEFNDPPVEMLFVYNCNPLATMPDQNRVLEGLKRDDLFTVVYEQVFTDTARYADVLLPATTFLENYDIAKGYGPISLQLVRPVIEPVGEARANAEVFSDLAARLGLGEAEEETDTLLRVGEPATCRLSVELLETGSATPPFGGAPIQFVDVFPLTPDRKIDLFPAALHAGAPAGLYGYQPDPGTERLPARAHLSGQRKERLVDARPSCVSVRRCCRCTQRTRGARTGDRRSRSRLQRSR